MTGTIHIRGGFNDPSIRAQMSPKLQAQIAQAEAREAQEAAREEQARAYRAQAFEERSLEAAIQLALENGEIVSPRRGRHEQLGHTRQEAVALFSAKQDTEDMQAEARNRVAVRKLLEQHAQGYYADTSAPTELELSERAEEQARRDRDLLARGRQIRTNQTIRSARRLARQDRVEDRLLGR